MDNGKQQRGMALLVVLLALALISILVDNILDKNKRMYLRTVSEVDKTQIKWYTYAAENMAKNILHRDKINYPRKTHLAQNWAQTELQIGGGKVRGRIFDAQACFNLNALSQMVENEKNTSYVVKVFRQLLLNLGVDASQIAQIISSISNRQISDVLMNKEIYNGVHFAHGASELLAQQRRMQDISELRMISGIDFDIYQKLLPYVCVLPTSTLLVNINTLKESQGVLLAALLLKDINSFPATTLLKKRPRTGWDSVAMFLTQLQLKESETTEAISNLVVSSNYFSVHLNTIIGDYQFNQYSLVVWKGKRIHTVHRKYR